MNRSFWFCFFLSSLFASETKICLSVRIDAESKGLLQCLESVKEIVDCISVRNKVAGEEALLVLENFLFEAGIPNRIEPFDESEEISSALRTLEEAGFSKETTYLLFLEPSDFLKIGSSFSKSSLEDDSYLLLRKSADQYHFDLRLIRAAAAESFRTLFSPHAFYLAPPFSTKLNNLLIEEKGETSPAPLIEFLKKNPNDAKAIFALAQSHRRLNHFEEAISWYTARVMTGEGGEEVWFSKYKIGECYESLGAWEMAFHWYLNAFQTDPKRPEPLLKIATHYRALGMNDIAYLFAKYGSEIPFPSMKNLYPFFCTYQFEEELSIASYYTAHREDGYSAANQLVLKRNVPGEVRDQTYRNLLFYVPRLKNARYLNVDFEIPLIEGTLEKYHPMNPSILKTKDGYKVTCRVVSYTQEGAKHFHTADPQGIFRNRNYLLTYDKEFRLLSQWEIIENLPRQKIPHFLLEGMEDCRIFSFGKSLWFTATCFDTNPTGNLQISLCKLRDKPEEKTIPVEKLTPLVGPDLYRCEKNWLPFVKDGTLHVVYSYDPFIVYRVDPETGECKTLIHYKPLHEFTRFRGSAPPIPFDGGYLLMVHEVVFMPEFTRSYLHRFLYLDADFQVQALSKPFLFDHAGVEFCCGMTASHSGKDLVMAIGLEDREAKLALVDFETIRSLLEPLPPLIEYPFME